MTHAKHTPGPWHIVSDAETMMLTVQSTDAMLGRDICDLQFFDERYVGAKEANERQDANARLIAAAPEILAALRTLVLYHDKDDEFLEACADYPAVHEKSYAQMEAEFWDAARAALAKAEGKV